MTEKSSAASSIATQLPAGRVLADEAYQQRRKVWNGAVDHTPELIVLPETAQEVAAAIGASRRHNLPISVRGGGHDWAGRAVREGALVVDLGALRTVEMTGDVARVGGGATADDLLAPPLRTACPPRSARAARSAWSAWCWAAVTGRWSVSWAWAWTT